MKPMIDLVAVAYEAVQETGRFLRSLDQVEVPFTLTITENNSPDPAVREVLRSNWNWIEKIPTLVSSRLILNEENVGYARACNGGAMLGSAPYIALLNCDTEWRAGVGEALIETFESDPSIGILGPRTTDLRGRLTHSGIVKQSTGMDGHRYWLAPDRGQALDVLDVPTLSGATYFVRREMWDQLTACSAYQSVAPGAEGAFLPTKHYFEETFCSYHAQAHGWRVVYDGRAHMIHEWNRSLAGSRAAQYFKESREFYLRACEAHDIVDHGATRT